MPAPLFTQGLSPLLGDEQVEVLSTKARVLPKDVQIWQRGAEIADSKALRIAHAFRVLGLAERPGMRS